MSLKDEKPEHPGALEAAKMFEASMACQVPFINALGLLDNGENIFAAKFSSQGKTSGAESALGGRAFF